MLTRITFLATAGRMADARCAYRKVIDARDSRPRSCTRIIASRSVATHLRRVRSLLKSPAIDQQVRPSIAERLGR